MKVMEAISRRKAVREYKSTPVPRDVLLEILAAARLAPSGGNFQNCYFGIITDEDKKRELANAAGGQLWIATAPVVIALCAQVDYNTAELPQDDFSLEVNKLRFGEEILRHLESCEDRQGVGILWANGSPLIPGTHITLAAASHWLDTCWVGYLDVQKAGQVLNLPSDFACLFLMPLGYAAEEPKQTSRKPLQELVFHNTWGVKHHV